MQLRATVLHARAARRPSLYISVLSALTSTATSTTISPLTCPGCGRAAGLASPTIISAAARYHASSRRQSAWAAAVSVASNVVSNAVSRATKGEMHIDPLRAVAQEMKLLTGNIRQLLGSGHPSLDRVAKYYTQAEGKHIRPLIVLLMSRATSLCPKDESAPSEPRDSINAAFSPLDVLADVNPSRPRPGYASDPEFTDSDILPSQRRLAEITELIHTASLLHDDVVDHSVSRRGSPSANFEFGNKMAVLAGDFLLGRASVALARLRNAEVTELLATVIANLVEGEFMQLKNSAREERNPAYSEEVLEYYLQKTYLKTGSLIAKSSRAAAVLGRADAVTVDAAYAYGRNLGLAFQLVDDMLDYTKSGQDLGKPAGADLELGLATAPLLFAWKTNPELGPLVGRKFDQEGDVQRARELVHNSDGIEQTRALAEDYSQRAISALHDFPDSEAKESLVEMAVKTLKRQK
ncbi:hexaprenyl pyrophosphate synthetase-like protein [Nemania sp. FL0916]|nr:hexaprenyl pyrophosphate synthetase-like protein [Nemania sp. FL0916]